MTWKLHSIVKSDRAGKKWKAYFEDSEGHHKTVHFGALGYEDFTQHKDAARADLYRMRHAKDLTTDAAKTGMSPGALSYYVLWTSPSFAQGVRNFKNRYKLQKQMAFNYAGMPIPTYEAVDKAITQRPTSTAILGIDSEDRYANYQSARSAQYPQQNWSAWDFSISKQQSILNGAFTRIALTEAMIQWGIPNINRKTSHIQYVYSIGGPTLGPFTLQLNEGFYTPSLLATVIQTYIRTLGGMGAFTMTYGVRTNAGLTPLTTNEPIFEYTAPPGCSIAFLPMTIDNTTYKPTTKQLFDLLGFTTFNSALSGSPTTGQQTFALFTKYIDVVCTQLTAMAAVKDTSSAPTPRDLVARIYMVDPSQQSTVLPSASTFCPTGCAPFTLYKDFSTPKQIQWVPNSPIGGYLKFDVYDDSGDSLAEVDSTLWGAGNSLNWCISLLASEN